MAKRRRSGPHVKKTLPKAAEIVGFTEADEAFFRAGDEPEALEARHEEYEEKPSLWRRLFSRRRLHAA